MKLANMKNFIAIVRDELNSSSCITVTGNNNELTTKNEFTLFMRYSENTLFTYSVTMQFDEYSDIVKYSINYIDDDDDDGITDITSVFHSITVNNAYELAQVVICICAIDTGACVVKFHDFNNEFMNFDNVFCAIVPMFDDLPFTIEMHTVNHIAIYSVCGANRDHDFECISTALRYFCTLCEYKID